MSGADRSAPRLTVVGADGNTPPHDLDAEAAVLSAVLLDRTAIDQVADVIKPEHFYAESHRRIFAAALDVHARGSGLDVVLVATELRDTDRLAQVGGMPYLIEVLNAAPVVSNVRDYAAIVVDKWTARQVIQVCQKYRAVGMGSYGTAHDYVAALAGEVHEIACLGEQSSGEMIHEILVENLRAAAAASRAGAQIRGLRTGFDRWDRMTGGLHDGELTIIAARPGMGKTALAMNAAVNVGMEGHAVAIFSLEMPRQQIVDRMLCAEARVDVSRLRCGMLTPTDWQKLTGAAAALDPLPILVDDAGALSMVDVRAKARRFQTEQTLAGRKLRLVVVDYLQLMRSSALNRDQSREQEVSEVSRGLKQLAKELGVPVIALSQLNRQVEARGEKKKRPQLADLRESGAIEQDADNILFIYRDDYYDKNSADRGIAELLVAKQRNGPTDTVKVKFDAQYTRFDDLPEGQYPDDEDRYG